MGLSTKNYTGTGALSQTFSPGAAFQLEQIRLTVDPAASAVEDYTVVLDSVLGTAYDATIIDKAMSGKYSVVCSFGETYRFSKNDSLVFSWANSDSRLWGLEIKFIVFC